MSRCLNVNDLWCKTFSPSSLNQAESTLSLTENKSGLHPSSQTSVCVLTMLPKPCEQQLYLFTQQAHLGHWTVYVVCFTSCWFWLMSSISCLTSSPLNFKAPSWPIAQLVVRAAGWHFSRALHLLSVCVWRLDLERRRTRERGGGGGGGVCACAPTDDNGDSIS